MQQITQVVQDTASGAHQSATAASQLYGNAEELQVWFGSSLGKGQERQWQVEAESELPPLTCHDPLLFKMTIKGVFHVRKRVGKSRRCCQA
jgi:hypothetical protein